MLVISATTSQIALLLYLLIILCFRFSISLVAGQFNNNNVFLRLKQHVFCLAKYDFQNGQDGGNTYSFGIKIGMKYYPNLLIIKNFTLLILIIHI